MFEAVSGCLEQGWITAFYGHFSSRVPTKVPTNPRFTSRASRRSMRTERVLWQTSVKKICRFFPAGIPHPIQGLKPDACLRTLRAILTKKSGVPQQGLEKLPKEELFIFNQTCLGHLRKTSVARVASSSKEARKVITPRRIRRGSSSASR